MRVPSPSPDPNLVLDDVAWVRALATVLVGEQHAADDLSQDTWLTALARRAPGDRPPREWLGGVMRNLLRQRRRDEHRRGDREREAAREEAVPSTDELVSKVSVQRAVVDAVLALEEPQRTTLLLRYFEELTPTEIARRTRTPLATVTARLARGLELVRGRLDRRHGGDGREWMLALLPLVDKKVPVAAGALIVSTKLWISAACVVCAAVAVWWAKVGVSEANPHSAAPAFDFAAADAVEAQSAPAENTARVERIDAASVANEPVLAGVAAPAVASTIHGRVIDLDGRPAASVSLSFRPSDVGNAAPGPSTSSTADGSFELPRPDSAGRIVAQDPAWRTLFAALVVPCDLPAAGVAPLLTVVVARPRPQRGVVLARTGGPVAGARVDIQLPNDMRQRFDAILDRSVPPDWITTSGPDGRFDIADAPAIDGAQLRASCNGYWPGRADAADGAVTIELDALDRPLVIGEVVDANGAPIAGAWVRLEAASVENLWEIDGTGHPVQFGSRNIAVRSDERGRFQIDPALAGDASSVVALALNLLPARFERPSGGWPSWIVLQLREHALSIAGSVVDGDGKPIAHARVDLARRTSFGKIDIETSGSTLRDEGFVENLIDPRPTRRGEQGVESDQDGRFELGGLLAQDYALVAFDPRTLARTEVSGIAAGSRAVVLRIMPAGEIGRVRGRVVDRRGHPLAGISVRPFTYVSDPRETFMRMPDRLGERHVSDAEGRFEYDALPRRGLGLEVFAGSNVHAAPHRLPDGFDPDAVEIVVSMRCHLRVDLTDHPQLAERFDVLDESGHELQLSAGQGEVTYYNVAGQLNDGKSEVLAAEDSAATLVLYKGDQEVKRVPIALVPGELTVLKP